MRHLFLVHYKHTDVGILILHMNKTNEASILLKSEKKHDKQHLKQMREGLKNCFMIWPYLFFFFSIWHRPFQSLYV